MADKKEYALLARLLLQQHPDIAASLLNTYHDVPPPVETDLSRLKTLFAWFVDIEGLQQSRLSPDSRRLFYCAILHLYCPHVFVRPRTFRELPRGLVSALSLLTGQKKSHLSGAIGQVIVWHKSDEAFGGKVNSVLKRFEALRQFG